MAKKQRNDRIIIPQVLSPMLFIGAAFLSATGVILMFGVIIGMGQKKLSVPAGLGLCLLGLLIIVGGVAGILASVFIVKNKQHLLLTDSHLVFRRGDKRVLGKVAYRDIHSTKIDYLENPPTSPEKMLFVYLCDGYDESTFWPSGWRYQEKFLLIPDAFKKTLEKIQDRIEDRLEELRSDFH